MKKLFVAALMLVIGSTAWGDKVDAPLRASLALKEVDNRLVAKIVVTQEVAQDGVITVRWTAPGSFCRSSTYELKYKSTKWNTHAFRTVRHKVDGQTVVCAGVWRVEVMDHDGNVLTSGEVEIK